MNVSKKTSSFLLSVMCGCYVLIALSLNRHAQDTQLKAKHTLYEHFIKYNVTFHNRSSNIKILLWTTFFDKMVWEEDIRKELKNCNCSLTSNKNEIEAVDAVVFHLLDLWFYKSLPKYRAAHQVWILFVAEPPPHIFSIGLHVPNMMFNWTMSYRRDSTIIALYGKAVELTQKEKENMETIQSFFKNKPKFMASVIGNCFDDARRYFEISDLKKHLTIDEYGRCGDLVCPRTHTCVKLTNKYKFRIAFENSHCRDYVSEKFWSALSDRHIPIVNWRLNQIIPAPSNSYINIYAFNSMREAAKYLIRVSRNSTLYDSYFDWKKQYKAPSINIWKSFPTICDKLRSKAGYQAQTLVNPWKWIQDDTCEMWSTDYTVIEKPVLITSFVIFSMFLLSGFG